MGDGLATLFAGLLGGPPNTTYSEVTGAVALTRAFDPKIMTFAAISAIILSFVSKLGAFLQTIPVPVMGGLFILLFGNIIVIGLSLLMKSKEDLHQPRNMAVLSIMLVTGIGGMTLSAGSLSLKGVGLASVLGLVLHLLLPKVKNV
jgi:uracil permease